MYHILPERRGLVNMHITQTTNNNKENNCFLCVSKSLEFIKMGNNNKKKVHLSFFLFFFFFFFFCTNWNFVEMIYQVLVITKLCWIRNFYPKIWICISPEISTPLIYIHAVTFSKLLLYFSFLFFLFSNPLYLLVVPFVEHHCLYQSCDSFSKKNTDWMLFLCIYFFIFPVVVFY